MSQEISPTGNGAEGPDHRRSRDDLELYMSFWDTHPPPCHVPHLSVRIPVSHDSILLKLNHQNFLRSWDQNKQLACSEENFLCVEHGLPRLSHLVHLEWLFPCTWPTSGPSVTFGSICPLLDKCPCLNSFSLLPRASKLWQLSRLKGRGPHPSACWWVG